tara:strand:- start:235 stop:678 length:444 start_codon:yes stop_codon:yes gene_type:complete
MATIRHQGSGNIVTTARVEIRDAVVRNENVEFEIDQPVGSVIDSFRVVNVGKIAVAGDLSVNLGSNSDHSGGEYVAAADCELIDNANDSETEIAANSVTVASALASGNAVYTTDSRVLYGRVNVPDATVTITGDNVLYIDCTFRIVD